jgi:hypothetical protein
MATKSLPRAVPCGNAVNIVSLLIRRMHLRTSTMTRDENGEIDGRRAVRYGDNCDGGSTHL